MRFHSLLFRRSFRSVLFILVSFIHIDVCVGQIWQPLGPDQRKSLGLDKQSVFKIFNRNDSIYTAVRNDRNMSLMIKRFNGTSWDTVGTPFFTGLNAPYTGPGYAIITLNKANDQFVAFPDPGQQVLGGSKPTVKKLVNGQWQTIGQPGIGSHAVSIHALEVDSFGTPYLSFNTIYDQKPHVMKFDGSVWVSIDPPAFATSSVSNPILKVDPQGTPYVAFVDATMVSVLAFVNNTWVPVGGSTAIASASSGFFLMTLRNDGFPVIAFQSTSTTVMEFDGTNWTTLPNPGNIPGYNAYLAVDAANMPYLLAGGYVRKFDGTTWNSLGPGPGQPASSGAFEIVGGQPVVANMDKVKRFDGAYWSVVGEYGYSPGRIQTNNIVLSSSGILFSAFKDYENGGKLTVKTYTNGTWSFVGSPGFTTDSVSNVDMAAGKNDTMFIVYTAAGFNKKAKVIRYDGVSWVELGSGTNTVSMADITNISIAVDTSGTPLVGFVDPTYFDACHVRKFDNGTWTSVGGGVMNTPPAYNLTLRVAPDNTIYLLTHLYLAKFTGATWQTLGNYNYSANKPDLVIDRNGTPYIAYTRFVAYGNLVNQYCTDYVIKFDGTKWIDLGGGADGINGAPWLNGAQHDVYSTSLALDSAGRLYLASSVEKDYSLQPAQIVIRTFNGTDWHNLSTLNHGWSGFYFPQLDFQLEAGNDQLYFAYDDDNAYLLGLPFPLWLLNVPEVGASVANVNLYPNPTTHTLTVSSTGLDANQVAIEIIDNIGRTAKSETAFCTNGVIRKEVNTESLAPGSYFILIKGKRERRVGKFIKE